MTEWLTSSELTGRVLVEIKKSEKFPIGGTVEILPGKHNGDWTIGHCAIGRESLRDELAQIEIMLKRRYRLQQ